MSKRGGPLLLGALGLSCYTSAPEPVTPAPPAGPQAAMTILAGSVGPITARTPGNLIALRRALPGYDVKPAHLALGPSLNRLGFNVYKDGEKLLQVLPDGSGSIFSVHAVSSKVVTADRPWKIGAKLNGVRSISTCKCWQEEVVVCFKVGDHVAVSFARECSWDSYTTDDERQDLIGVPIHRVLWSPRPFGEGSNPYGGEEYGGDDYGGD
jgi:hypothetical protein